MIVPFRGKRIENAAGRYGLGIRRGRDQPADARMHQRHCTHREGVLNFQETVEISIFGWR